MKGVVFTEFIEMVEQEFSADMVDTLYDEVKPASTGVYTAVGSYPFSELAALLSALSRQSGLSQDELLLRFGHYLFGRLVLLYPQLIASYADTLSLLQHLDDTIHVEVFKLYPGAELPRFEVVSRQANKMRLDYRSPRGLGCLAHGLIQGALDHFGEPGEIRRWQAEGGPDHVCFEIEVQRG